MAYDPTQAKAIGAKLVDLIYAAADGIGSNDMEQAIAFVMALKDGADEFSTDKDATVLFVISGASEAFAQKRLNLPQ